LTIFEERIIAAREKKYVEVTEASAIQAKEKVRVEKR